MSWCRVGTSFTVEPPSAATARSHAPAASTTTGARISPRFVRTPKTLPPVVWISWTSVFGSSAALNLPAAAA